jgi:hypothetical protein
VLLYTPYVVASTPSSVKLVEEVTTPTVSSRPSSSGTDGIDTSITRSPATTPWGDDIVTSTSSPLVRFSTLLTPPPVVAHGDSAASAPSMRRVTVVSPVDVPGSTVTVVFS